MYSSFSLTHTFLATRAKMQLSTRVGQAGGGRVYGQPEGALGDSMLRSAKRLGDTNLFGKLNYQLYVYHFG